MPLVTIVSYPHINIEKCQCFFIPSVRCCCSASSKFGLEFWKIWVPLGSLGTISKKSALGDLYDGANDKDPLKQNIFIYNPGTPSGTILGSIKSKTFQMASESSDIKKYYKCPISLANNV